MYIYEFNIVLFLLNKLKKMTEDDGGGFLQVNICDFFFFHFQYHPHPSVDYILCFV